MNLKTKTLIKNLSLVFAVIGLLFTGQVALAASSTNYQIQEDFVGGGGLIQSNSNNYKSNESIGDVGVGNSSSSSYQTNSGYTTTSDPALTFLVNTSSINFGTLSTSAATTATSTFSVIDYTSYGYVVQIYGNPPSNGSYTLANMSSATTSSTGTEQFGINLKSNSSPSSFGADPSGGLGIASSGYDAANNFKYNSGDTIASAPKSSAQTNFTISYLVNASIVTRAGSYSGTQTIICTGTY